MTGPSKEPEQEIQPRMGKSQNYGRCNRAYDHYPQHDPFVYKVPGNRATVCQGRRREMEGSKGEGGASLDGIEQAMLSK